jgi:hypothetical protein
MTGLNYIVILHRKFWRITRKEFIKISLPLHGERKIMRLNKNINKRIKNEF